MLGKNCSPKKYGKSFVFLREKCINSNTFHSLRYEYNTVYHTNNLQWRVTSVNVYTCVIHSNSAAWQPPAVKEQHEEVEIIHQARKMLNSKVVLQFHICAGVLIISSYRKL